MAWKSIRKRKWRRTFSPAKLIALIFLGIIAVGTGLLCLPIASRTGQSRGFLDALFTATSATCVTGLVPGDTYTLWSGFGQTVILLLIEIGGAGNSHTEAMVATSVLAKAVIAMKNGVEIG